MTETKNNDKMNWNIKKRNDINLLTLDTPEGDAVQDWEQWVLLSSDWHADNTHFDKALWSSYMDKAKARNAAVFGFGDVFCAMGGRLDNRRSGACYDKDTNVAHYFDAIVDKLDDYTKPYAENIAFISPGNHELSPLKFNGTDLINRLQRRINDNGGTCERGDIGGWVFVRANINGRSQTCKIKYHHGGNAGGIVTKGVINAARRAVYVPDCNIMVSGHIHESWNLSIVQERVSQQGHLSLQTQEHICLPTFKQEYGNGSDFHNLLERPPKPLGATWLRFFAEYDKEKKNTSLKWEVVKG